MTTTDYQLAAIKLWHAWLDANPDADEYELSQAFDAHMTNAEGYEEARHLAASLRHERHDQTGRAARWTRYQEQGKRHAFNT
jgi:hypothetical protein